MGKRSVIADIRDAFGSELDAGQQSALISWLAFTGTFSGVRGVTHAIRAGKGPFKNLSVGGEHLHHYMWGIGMLAGVGAIAVRGDEALRRHPATALAYGAGLALIVGVARVGTDGVPGPRASLADGPGRRPCGRPVLVRAAGGPGRCPGGDAGPGSQARPPDRRRRRRHRGRSASASGPAAGGAARPVTRRPPAPGLLRCARGLRVAGRAAPRGPRSRRRCGAWPVPRRVGEPGGGPEPVHAPAEPLQVLLAQPVAVTHAARVPVARAVGLDREDHPRRVVGVRGREVDPVAADAVLRHHRDAEFREPGGHVRVERAASPPAPSAAGSVPPA